MSSEDIDSTNQATFLIGEAVRRVMMREVKDIPSELMQIAEKVMAEIVPAVLMPDEFHLVEVETGIYPPDFRAKYGDRFRKPG